MKIEIWSDVMCPFCYIGKRHLEKALAELPFGSEIELEWKSYQLDPKYKNTDGEDLYAYFAKNKGIAKEQAQQITAQVLEMASNVGLNINFDKSIPANSFNAHQLIHLAAKLDKQTEMEEALFAAHFVDGLDIDDVEVLVNVAEALGFDGNEAREAIVNKKFEEQVRYDIYEGQQIGVKGVPFFVLNQKYGLSGAQPVEAFKQAITQAYNEG
jgi:predicted DsbA family dithiol-disulfide isomerase